MSKAKHADSTAASGASSHYSDSVISFAVVDPTDTVDDVRETLEQLRELMASIGDIGGELVREEMPALGVHDVGRRITLLSELGVFVLKTVSGQLGASNARLYQCGLGSDFFRLRGGEVRL